METITVETLKHHKQAVTLPNQATAPKKESLINQQDCP